MSDSEFYNPYQFIPVTGRIKEGNKAKESEAFDYKEIAEGEDSPVRHDIWHKDGLSGSFQCTLKLAAPTFVGGKRVVEATDKNPAQIEHYLRNGIPAIPGNSLRGMVGTLVETLSQSTLRILGNENYSVREDVRDANDKKIGRVMKIGDSFFIKELDYFGISSKNANTLIAKQQEYYYGDPTGDSKAERVFLHNNSQGSLVKGQLRILDAPSEDMPGSRKSELFVYDANPDSDPLELGTEQISAYEQICEERWNATKNSPARQPYLYKGWQGKANIEPWRIQDGLLIYYRSDPGGRVKELSLSQVWRKNTGRNAHDFFRNIDPMLLPWGSGEREELSIAERLFGVAEDLSLTEQLTKEAARNLASRVRFGDALPCDKQEFGDWQSAPPVTLRILSSPKPPSPALYFKAGRNGGHPPAKQRFKNSPTPNGRKYYLHHPQQQIDNSRWKSRTGNSNLKQKVSVKPLPAGTEFFFTVEFDNLSNPELSLLKKALQPGDRFYHRLGMGKSLGLGKVKISYDNDKINYIDRKKIYAARREDGDKSSGLYAAFHSSGTPANTDDHRFIDQGTLDILKLIGDPSKLKENIDVRPPLSLEQVKCDNWEDEGFRWFVHNDRQNNDRQYLNAIQPGAEALPTLLSLADNKKSTPLPDRPVEPPGKSEWLMGALVEIRANNDKLRNKSDHRLLKGTPLAKHWRDIPSPKDREVELARLRVQWDFADIGPNTDAKDIYDANTTQSAD
ncbi:MAG: TIGR03986 family CRISPR-associated RAMP protein [Gammaproteobacteria bacterium]|nr:TIGR03986 family CRISPR-associated RAMP protein [Gammaproteobacteria bacterium]